MKQIRTVITPTLSACALLASIGTPAMAQDPVKVAPDKYKVLLDNEQVRVLEVRDKPGDKAEMHRHPDYIVYFFSSSKRRFTFPDGRVVEAGAQPPGSAIFRPSVTHSGENVGTVEEHVLIIELKESAK